MREEWKTLPEYPGYMVSSTGLVKSFVRFNLHANRWGKTDSFRRYDSVMLKGEFRNGYRRVRLRFGPVSKRIFVHRLVALAFIPNPLLKPHINHKNGNPSDNRVENLEWVTQSENMTHAHAVLGKRNYNSKLTAKDVREIRAWWKTGDVSLRDIARTWGIGYGAARATAKGLMWKHVA